MGEIIGERNNVEIKEGGLKVLLLFGKNNTE